MKKLYIDFDGVVLDTIPYLYKALDESGVDTSIEDERRKFLAEYDFTKIINDNNILCDSINCIRKLLKSNLFDMTFLSHINSLAEAKAKIEYIRNHFKEIPIIVAPAEITKTKMVNPKDTILVDDYSGNLYTWKSSGGIPVRFNTKGDTKGFTTIDRLDKLIEMFGEEKWN